jgi:hypothetical protein
VTRTARVLRVVALLALVFSIVVAMRVSEWPPWLTTDSIMGLDVHIACGVGVAFFSKWGAQPQPLHQLMHTTIFIKRFQRIKKKAKIHSKIAQSANKNQPTEYNRI